MVNPNLLRIAEQFGHDMIIEPKKKNVEILTAEEVLVFGSTDGVYAYNNNQAVRIAERDRWVNALAVYNGELYDGGNYGKVFRTLTGEAVAERNEWVRALAVCGGVLYDGGSYGIFKTMTDEPIITNQSVFSMISMPKKSLGRED